MIRYISLFLLSIPLLACAAETADSESTALQKRINTVQTGKSNHSDRQYWHSLLKWSDECESDFRYPASVSGIDVYPENDKQYIVQVMCTFGSYQGRQKFFYVSLAGDKTTVSPLPFPQYEVNKKKAVKKETSVELWGSVLNDSDHNKFIILNQYSGNGHCGTLTTYKIADGKVTTLTFRAQPDCELEKASRDPKLWHEYPLP